MALTLQEVDKIRLHIGIQSGYQRIEQDGQHALVGSKEGCRKMTPLPTYGLEIEHAGKAFQYLSSPLLHDLNRITMLLNAWDEHLHPVPNKALRQLVESMESWISDHGGKA